MRQTVQPTISKGDGVTHDTVETHPAYGQVTVGRVSGGTYLYGSDFLHHHYVTLTIHQSKLHRGLSNDWPHQTGELISIAMSEAQWATLVSSLNQGSGVRCTLEHVGTEMVPGIAAPTNRHAQFKREAEGRLDDALQAIAEAVRQVEASKLSGVQKQAIKGQLSKAQMNLTSNLQFVADQFGEHLEKAAEAAKIEVEAHMNAVIARAGLQALGGQVLALGEGDKQ